MPRAHRLRAFGVLCAVTWGLTTHGKPSASGDEPHVLMQAQSLLADGDLDLANNYAQDDARLFGRGGLVNDGHAVLRPDGTLGSTHDPGVALLLLPAYAAARAVSHVVPDGLLSRARLTPGLLTYAIVSVALLTLVAWCTSGLLPVLAEAWPHGRPEALLYLAALSPPIVSHAFLLFPDTVMFAVVCAVVARAVPRAAASGGAGAGTRDLLVVAVLLGLAPWLHRKFSPLALALAAATAWTRRDDLRATSARDRVALVAFLGVPHVAFYVWTWWQWHSLLGPQFLNATRLDPSGLLTGLLGLVADRDSGLLAFAPMYAVLPACVLAADRRWWPLFAAAMTLVLPLAAFDEWWGGYSPAARYLVPVMPIALVCLASGLRRRPLRLAGAGLALLQAVIDVAVWRVPRHLWPHPDGNALHLALGASGRLLHGWLPSLRGAWSPTDVGVFLVSMLAVTWGLWRMREREAVRAGASAV